MKSQFVLGFTGGGTAGHVLPHFAVASHPDSPVGQLLRSGELRVVYFGSQDGVERGIVCEAQPDWVYVPIRTGKLRRYFSWQNFIDPFNIIIGFFKALYEIRRQRVGCLFSKGGFVSAPVVWAAWLNRVPVVIHESDATPALATRLTLPFAKKALVSFDETMCHFSASQRSKILALGLPLRAELFGADRASAHQFFGTDPMRPTLLVFGGSLGAEGLNRKVAAAMHLLKERWNVIHIVGRGKKFQSDFGSYYRQYEFLLDEMKFAYAVADIAVCRAGASSIFELAAARIPMLLVPLGLHQSRGDQIINANIFVKKGWAESCEENSLSPERIVESIENMMSQRSLLTERLEKAPDSKTAVVVGELLLSMLRNESQHSLKASV